MRESVREVLGQEPDAERPFMELGLTSLSLVRIRLKLQAALGRRIEDTEMFEHASVVALARHLASSAPSDAASRTAPAQDVHGVPPAGRPPGDERRIAVIGLAARLPGAADADAFWDNLRAGVSGVRHFTPQHPAAGRKRVGAAGLLDDADRFDAAFFGMSRQEAELTDPGHRLFLEVCQHALEQAGYAGPAAGARIGVYAGGGMNLYGPQPPYYTRYAMGSGGADTAREMLGLIGSQSDFLASRVAYRLGLTGAAVGVQTACSTGLVAVHMAARSLLAGDEDMALAGACAVHVDQHTGYRHEPDYMLSATGVCRAFDAASDGTVGGSGVAVVLLKRLDRALADGDTVHAVVLGSAVNNDGAVKAGFTAPSVAGHTDVVRRALARAEAEPDSVGYVEAHGTGTRLGDPIEFEALSRAYASDRGRTGFCALGAVKPGIGHLDTCAGMAGLVKTILMLRHRTLVPTVNVTSPDPRLPWATSPFRLAAALEEWAAPEGTPRRAGVSALGFGGTNAHVILEEPPEPPARPLPGTAAAPVVVPLSARHPEALRDLAVRLRDHLAADPGIPAADVQFTLAHGRPRLKHRLAVAGRTAAELARALDAALPALADRAPGEAGPLAFAYAGQGGTTAGMARELYAAFPVVREVLDACEEIHRRTGEPGGLLDLLVHDRPPAGSPAVQQPALFAYQMALTRLFASFGVEPDHVIGHSLGEIAALCTAGALPLADALRFTAVRGRLMSAGALRGGMLAVAADEDTVTRVCRTAGVEPAAANGPRAHVVAGDGERLAVAERLLEAEGVATRRLPLDQAFHSRLVDAVLPELRAAAAELRFSALRIPCAATAEGRVMAPGTVPDADFLVRQARRPVLFHRALHALDALGCRDFLEVGPGEVLTGLGRAGLRHAHWTPAQARGTGAEQAVWEAVARLHGRGAEVDFDALAPRGRRIPLPVSAFRRDRFAAPGLPAPGAPHPAAAAVADAPAAVPRPAAPTAAVPGPAAAPEADPRRGPAGTTVHLARRQLDVMNRMSDDVSRLMAAQLRLLPVLAAQEEER
ncbi:hypothetical protein GCM10018793_69610 [Streptomyces sulfonofaciens]|uniref:Type I polyketide synthase n=1 Tax=Streptomyces sulfonofaciens TaxID=68272 RepID=A0A919GPU0_9ACTN|nr:hypothetical protein GCM10018793_69610 [Streptomyces sulfonofaciens]